MSGSQPKITNFFLCQNNAAANKAPLTVAESPTKPAPRRSKLSLKHKNVAAISNDRGKRLKPDPARCSNGSDLKERAPQDACQASASAESVPECCTSQVLRGGTSGTEKSPVVGADSSETTVLETDSAERAATEPRVPYYLENLVLIVNSVMNSDDWRLFSDEEKQMFATFLDADEKCQKLLARLLQRKHIWRKASKITYPDIAENLESVLLALQEKGYLEDVAHLNDLATTMSLLSPMETKSLAQMFRLKTSGRGKGNLAESLLEHCSKQQSVLAGSPRNTLEQLALKKALSLLGAAWRLRDEPRDAWRRLLRLFSLGTPWDGEEAGETPQVYGLQLVSAGKMAFPEYQVWRKDILFAEREDLIRYETARVLESQLMQAALDKKWAKARELLDNVEALARTPDSVQCGKRDQALPPFLRRFTTTGVYTRCRCLGVDVLQRLKEHRRAVRLLRALLGQTHFCLSRRGHWWDRLALNLDVHLGKPGHGCHQGSSGGERHQSSLAPCPADQSSQAGGQTARASVGLCATGFCAVRRHSHARGHNTGTVSGADGTWTHQHVCGEGIGRRPPSDPCGGSSPAALQRERLPSGDPRGRIHIPRPLWDPVLGRHLCGRCARRVPVTLPGFSDGPPFRRILHKQGTAFSQGL
ncbi:fanconi-associated nuclease 1 isoform X2 [Ixodes scapularis]|uniref:fanconi-associated nuclease 1 isoform X2 n=1 Tax=Ixodes scapularis TaxID=6945 RepID=UPI001C37F64F|nr:fanconi-associated nuclease 1 isoform X2 [Ixodes scapularis]